MRGQFVNIFDLLRLFAGCLAGNRVCSVLATSGLFEGVQVPVS